MICSGGRVASPLEANLPSAHPRHKSLATRERLKDALRRGLIHETGMIAHGRGEAFDYLLGEQTVPEAHEAAKVAAAALLSALKPVISMNGNVVALAAKECVELARATKATLEVNLFHRTEERVARLVAEVQKVAPGVQVLGLHPDARIPDLSSDRALCSSKGLFAADTVLVPLEDGDRCEALKKMGKLVIAIDLNPLSRTAKAADVTIVDELTRALPLIAKEATAVARSPRHDLGMTVKAWDNAANLDKVLHRIARRLEHLGEQHRTEGL